MRVRNDAAFFWLASITWLLFFVIDSHPVATIGVLGCVGFSLVASGISFTFLRLLGYFDALRLVPRKSDELLVLIALPAGGIVTSAVFRFISRNPDLIGYQSVVLGAPVLTLVLFGSHYSLSKATMRKGRKRKVVMDLLPFEKQILLKEFKERDYLDTIEILSRRDLQVHVRAGKTDIDLIIISRRTVQDFKDNPFLLRAHLAGVPILDYRSAAASLSGRCRLSDADLWFYLLGAKEQTHFLRLYTQAKWVVEPCLAMLLMFLFSPLFLIAALGVRFSSPGPIVYRQVRTGYKGRLFTLYKFRSMRTDSEKDGPQWAQKNDARVTRFGDFMRKTRLDELPQLVNVLRGEMSFCGPRPERPEIYAKIEEDIPLFSLRTIVRPGITGWAQVFAGYAASVEESLIKLEYDLYYIQRMSPRLDIVILVQTVWVALFGDKNKAAPLDQGMSDGHLSDAPPTNYRLDVANG